MNFRVYLTALQGPMTSLLRLLGSALAIAAFILAIAAVLVIDGKPAVWHKPASSQQYFSDTRKILSHTVSPIDQPRDRMKVIVLSADDLTSVANFLMMRKRLRGFAQASIQGSRLVGDATVRLTARFSGLFVNFRVVADDAEPMPRIVQVKVGRLTLPRRVMPLLGWWLTRRTPIGRYVRMTGALLHEVGIGDGRLRVVLNWDREIMGYAQELVADLADKERLRFYHVKLAEVVGQSPLRRFIGLTTLMRPLFALAKERSEAEGGVAVEENRALILVLGAYTNGKNLAPAIFGGQDSPALPRREVLLSRRVDAAQHFTASALMAIAGHRAFADMIGLAKEFNDTHGGSGFSFIDLAADRAGARFGKIAVSSEDSARRMQEILTRYPDESTFMPAIRDLPESLGAEEFTRQFVDIESPQFAELKKKIEERIAACRLYQ